MRVLSFILVLIFSSLGAAETYYLEKLTGQSLPQDELAAIEELLRDFLTSRRDVQLVTDPNSADFVLRARALRLGSDYIFALRKIKGEQVIYTDKAKAKSVEEMDAIVKKVARAVITQVEVAEDLRIDEVTEDEATKGLARIGYTSQNFVGFGPGASYNLGTDNTGYYLQLGHVAGLGSQFSVGISLEGVFTNDSNAFLGQASLSLEYYFNNRNTSPYISGGFGYGGAVGHVPDSGLNAIEKAEALSDASVDGFTYSVGGGIKFFRAYKMNLGASLKFIYVSDRVAGGHPSALVGGVVIYFPASNWF